MLVSTTLTLPSPVRSALEPVTRNLARAAVLLDFDGTLAPIVERAADARMPDETRRSLETIREHVGLVGFVSGRSLADLERMVAMPGCAYAGNHGLEIHHPGGVPGLVDAAIPWTDTITAFGRSRDHAILSRVGVILEDKGATLTFHWRAAPDPVIAHARLRAVERLAAEAAGLRVTWGRMVMEVRPPVEIDKGTAVRALLAPHDLDVALYIGDDRTDADAWRALHELAREGVLSAGVGIAVVGDEVPPDVRAEADVEVLGTEGAAAVLAHLAAHVPGANRA